MAEMFQPGDQLLDEVLQVSKIDVDLPAKENQVVADEDVFDGAEIGAVVEGVGDGLRGEIDLRDLKIIERLKSPAHF